MVPRVVKEPSPSINAFIKPPAPIRRHGVFGRAKDNSRGDIAYSNASERDCIARIRVGDITATVVFGPTEYAMSANGRAGGLMKALMDGEGSFTTRGTITDGHPVPTNCTSKIVSDARTSDVTMVLEVQFVGTG